MYILIYVLSTLSVVTNSISAIHYISPEQKQTSYIILDVAEQIHVHKCNMLHLKLYKI